MSRLHLAAIGLCASLSIYALQLSAADSAAGKPKFVKIVNVASGKILAVEDDSPDSGTHAVLAKDVESSNKHSHDRQWKLDKDGSYYKIANRASGEVLDVDGESTEEDHPIIVWDDKDEGNDNQRWTWDPKASSVPLVDAKTASQDSAGQYSAGQYSAGQYSAKQDSAKSANGESAKAQAHRIKSKSSGLVLDVDSEGNIVQRSANPNAKSQLWLVVGVDD